MPVDSQKAEENWMRYAFARDNGHQDFVRKANICEQYFYGNQWREDTRRRLEQQMKPVLTINKIFTSMLVIMGEQLEVQGDVAFRPTESGNPETAAALTKVYKSITRSNAMDFEEAQVFNSGIIRSRGFFDVRLGFDDHLRGEVKIKSVNSKNVLIDPDASGYDPDEWKEVFYTKWMTTNEIQTNFNEADGKALENKDPQTFRFGVDSTDQLMNTFGGAVRVGRGRSTFIHPSVHAFSVHGFDSKIRRLFRVIERQYKDVRKRKHFVDRETGDMRPIPDGWDQERIKLAVQKFDFLVLDKKVEQIRFTTTVDDRVLFDDWGPYKHFTLVPYFPVFHEGSTLGLVENMLSPQDMLNKTSSQELHVVNTTANSGWQMEEDQLVNMDEDELQARGAETGLVIVRRKGSNPIEKIQPNQVPTGLDRMGFKADEWTKEISGASDSKRGFDRADVSSKAITAKQKAGSINFAVPLSNLVRTRHLVARNVIDIVQEYYDEERLFRVTSERLGGPDEEIRVNITTPEGTIMNDLTMGEYDVAVTDVPLRETFEQSQFDEAVQMRRDLGIQIPDNFILELSSLAKKNDIAAAINEANQGEGSDPAAQELAQLEVELKKVEIEKEKAITMKQKAEAAKAVAEARAKAVEAETGGAGATDDIARAEKARAEAVTAQREFGLKEQEMKENIELKRRELSGKQNLERAKLLQDMKLQREKGNAEGKSKS